MAGSHKNLENEVFDGVVLEDLGLTFRRVEEEREDSESSGVPLRANSFLFSLLLHRQNPGINSEAVISLPTQLGRLSFGTRNGRREVDLEFKL